MENEELIRHQMEDTRTSLTEKIETLEQQVMTTVHEATSAVSDTVAAVKDSVQDTVATVKDSFQDTVTTVKDSVEDTVTAVQDTVKQVFDVQGHVERYPWLMVGGAVGLGYVLGSMLAPRPGPASTVRANPPIRHTPRMAHGNGGLREKTTQVAPVSWIDSLGLGPEVAKLKGLALGALLGTVREMVVKAVPEHMGGQLKELVDNVTQKLGGEPIPSSDWAGCSSEGEHHESRHDTEMGGTVGSAHRQGPQAMGRFDR